MSCYGPLAEWYDDLTGDVPYSQFADFYEAEFNRCGGEFRLLLDLCCGTGTLTCEMAKRGYELIAVDSSIDMLIQAQEKSASLPTPPIYLHQDAAELDLYGTVDAAYCSLDGMNYLCGDDLPEIFRRLHLFVRPSGLLIFDIRPAEWLKALDGEVFVDENDDVLCLWRADFDEEMNAIVYGMDIFSKVGRLWERSSEEHIEYAHENSCLKELLEKSGFTDIRFTDEGPHGKAGRIFVIARRDNA